jgi:hypothetical protein
MFGRDKKVRIPVPGTPVMIVDDASHKDVVEAELKRNAELEEANIDKTVADSFPASDPPSSVPETKESTRQKPEEKKVA